MMTARDFAHDFVPAWIDLAQDRHFGGVVERLDRDGHPVQGEPKTTLVQARTIFSLAQLYLVTGNQALLVAARDVHAFMTTYLRLPHGGYRYSVEPNGEPGTDQKGAVCRAYDQSFALLALVTLQKADPATVDSAAVDDLWSFIETLVEPATGALYEDDVMAARGARVGDRRAQNPQMHMLEALLQAYELTSESKWLQRATDYVALAEGYFIDASTCAIREFVAHDLSPLEGPDGARREPGHQYEWAWLLERFIELGGDGRVKPLADRMAAFADSHGVRHSGDALDGAPFDAVDASGSVTEATHLLWPLTEAGKLASLHHLQGRQGAADRARELERLIFAHYFGVNGLHWGNQLDGAGNILWDDALSRLIYHVLLFVTEGARAGVWVLDHHQAD